MSRIGVFICWCGTNIAATVDVRRVAEAVAGLPGVIHSTTYKYMCSDPGQQLIIESVREENLDRIVVAACSPHLHQQTFMNTAIRAGLNPYLCEMANIREHCSWVHPDKERGTEKAIDIVRMMVAKVRQNAPLAMIRVPIVKRALVIGGGIAGIQAALDIAAGG
jgi:heterodisulfide reductase subunit A